MSEPLFSRPSVKSAEQSFQNVANLLDLNNVQIAHARLAGVTNEREFFSFLTSTPYGLEDDLFDTPDLTERLARNDQVATMLQKARPDIAVESYNFGAAAPSNVAFKEGDSAPVPSDSEIDALADFEPGPLANEEPVFAAACGPWPIRDQGRRGTCVSFAAIAAFELYNCSSSNLNSDLSEQFLYWAIKHNNLDGRPKQDGTWYEFAVQALAQYGICDESVWNYDPTFIANNISHNPPPANAENIARAHKTNQPSSRSYSVRSGKASILLNLLKRHNGVGIALPVFDPPVGNRHNWITRVAETYGAVQNPVPGWHVNGGHAVLCVGFVPDALEPLGGHFIIRNSWNTTWGHGLPDPSYAGPEPGYGQITASYIDRYLWETCVF